MKLPNNNFYRRRGHAWYSTMLCRLLAALLISVVIVEFAESAQTVTQEKVESALREHILSSSPWRQDDLEVRVVSFKPVSLPSGPVNFRILKPTKGVTPGAHTFFVAIEVAGKEESKIWVRAAVRVFEEVVVTSYPLAHHELIGPKNVRLERREITALSNRPITRIDDVIGKQAARAIEVNAILTQSAVEQPRLVRRGSSLVLVYETQALRVETPGTAEEGGKVGDMIQVKNPTSGKLLRGVVIDGRTVRVN